MKLRDIEITLRGQCVRLGFLVSNPDPSIGLFGWTIEDYSVIAEDGTELDWELTQEELQWIQPQVDGYMHRWASDEY